MYRVLLVFLVLVAADAAWCAGPATHPATTEPAGMVTRVYEVGPLTRYEIDRADKAAMKASLVEIQDLLIHTIAPGEWSAPAAIRVISATESLAITQTPARHAEIVRLFEALRERQACVWHLLIHTVAADPAALPEGLSLRLKSGGTLDDHDLRRLLAASVGYTPMSKGVVLALPMAIRDPDGRLVGEIRASPEDHTGDYNITLVLDGDVVGDKPPCMQARLSLTVDRNVFLELGGVHTKSLAKERFTSTQDLLIPVARSAILADVPVETDNKKPLHLYVLLRPTINTGGVKIDD